LIDYSAIPEATLEGIALWVVCGVDPGDFLAAVLDDKLVHSFRRADTHNTRAMQAIAGVLYNEVPAEARGPKRREWPGKLNENIEGIRGHMQHRPVLGPYVKGILHRLEQASVPRG